MYQRLGGFVARHWVLVIIAWAALAVGVDYAALPWDDVTHDGDLAYLPARMTSVQGERLLARAFPGNRSKSQLVLVVARSDRPLSSDDRRVLDHLAQQFQPGGDHGLQIMEVWTPWTEVIGKKLVSPDRKAALAVLLFKHEFMAISNIQALEKVEQVLEETRQLERLPEGLRLGVTGSAAIGGDMLASAAQSVRNTEVATVVLVVVILLLVYRAPVLVLIPLATIAVAVAVSLDLVALLTQAHRVAWLEWLDFKVFKTTKIFVVVILFGSGTDFCLFLISRYKEELEAGFDSKQAVARALGHVGEALAGSALTTILGLSTMFFADFEKYRNSGPAIGLCLAVALAACLTLAPALLRAVGGAVFWPFGSVLSRRADEAARGAAPVNGGLFGGFWDFTSRAIIARPGTILLASLFVLSPLAWRGLSVEVSYDLLGELRDDRPSVQGTRLLRRHFYAGDTGPVTVLAHRQGAGFDTPEQEQEVARLTKLLYDLPGVRSVRSLAEPLGDQPGLFNPFSAAGRRKLAARKHPQSTAIYLSQAPGFRGEVTRLDVILAVDPFSRTAVETLDQIDRILRGLSNNPESPWHGTSFVYAGTTAGVRDLKAVTQSDQVLIQRLVVVAVLMVLIVILRRPLICLYLIVTVLFSYLVTIGATELVFGWLYPSFDGLDWKVPIFLFVILTAVGEDYNIYLVTRVFEEQRRWGPLEGLRQAVVRTGGIITSCGVIMAGTFLSMMFGTLRGMLELGFALSLGVVLDTMVVRPVLVPAFLALLHKPRARRPALPAGEASAHAASAASGH
ncbi:MAG: MMPL family transporter [Pirellulales bacterium]